MSRNLPKPCPMSGCPNLNCTEHRRYRKRYHPPSTPRLSAARRGYGRRWRRLRLIVLRANPICAKCDEPATDIDHITPRVRGGTDSFDNLQALCHSCHSIKTRREQQQTVST